MVVEIEKSVLIEIMEELVELKSLTKENLLNKLIFKEKVFNYPGISSEEVEAHGEKSEEESLEIAYRIQKLSDIIEKQIA